MSQSVNPANGAPGSGRVPADSGAIQTGQASVAPGYSGQNSYSSSEEGSAVASVAAALPEPEESDAKARDFVSKSFEASIDASLSSVRLLQKINPQDIYLNDTDSLLLMMKSVVSELVALASMQSIDQAYGNRQQAQSFRQSKAKQGLVLKERIKERQSLMADIGLLLNDRQGALADKTLKENLLTNARDAEANVEDRSGEISQLTMELTGLDQEVCSIQSEVGVLQEDVNALQALNVADKSTVAAFKRALSVVQEGW